MLRNQTRDQKTRLEDELQVCRPILDNDREWLDSAGNLVDEERVADALDRASDYEQGLERPNSQDKPVVEKRKNLAGNGAPRKRCKRPLKTSGDQKEVTQKPAMNGLDLNPTAHAEMLVKNALEDPEATGVLQPSNQMDITALPNPPVKSHNIFGAIAKDIFEAMMDAKKLRERGDVNNDDIDVPTRREALQAALKLRKYLGTINDPFARELELEAMLGSDSWSRCRS